MSDPGCSASEAVNRAITMINNGGQYLMGTGDYAPVQDARNVCTCCGQTTVKLGRDTPWTDRGDGVFGSDCAGFAICYCWKVKRHRPGFAKGFPAQLDPTFADVDDDVNCNSLIEDAVAAHTLSFEVTGTAPRAGDLLVYPTIILPGHPPFVGHVGIVLADAPTGYKPGEYGKLTVAQCHGPNGFKPGVVKTDGSVWAHHDVNWPKPSHRTRVVGMRERPYPERSHV